MRGREATIADSRNKTTPWRVSEAAGIRDGINDTSLYYIIYGLNISVVKYDVEKAHDGLPHDNKLWVSEAAGVEGYDTRISVHQGRPFLSIKVIKRPLIH